MPLLHVTGCLLTEIRLFLGKFHRIKATVANLVLTKSHAHLHGNRLQRRRIPEALTVVLCIGICHFHVVRKGLAQRAVHNDQKPLFSRQCCVLPLNEHLPTINFVLPWTFPLDTARLLNLGIVFQEVRNVLIKQVARITHVGSIVPTGILLRRTSN